MRVTVTGSEGSMMQWTIKHLLENGHEVLGIDNHARYDDYDHTRMVDEDRYDYRGYDLTVQENANDAVKGADVVINAAGLIYGVGGFHKYPADILENDVTLDRNVTKAAEKYDVDRMVNISSSMVYEMCEAPHCEGDTKKAPIPSTDYGLSKIMGERYCEAYKKQYDLDYTIWRPFNVITPYEMAEDEQGKSHVFADFMKQLVQEQQNPLGIFGDGKQVRCFTWIDDVAQVIANHVDTEESRNEIFNLGNEEPATMRLLAKMIYSKAIERGMIPDQGRLEFEKVREYDDDVRVRIPDCSKAREELGWSPRIGLDQSLERCLDNYSKLQAL